MVLPENTTREGPQRSPLLELPMDLHICIRGQLLADPDSTVEEFRQLRLVCKKFNDVWAPIIVPNMVLFQTDSIDDALVKLHHIVHSKTVLAAYRTLTIQNLCCLDTPADQLCSDTRRLREGGIMAVLMLMAVFLGVASILFITLVIYLILSALTIYPIFSGFLYLAKLPVKVISHIGHSISKFRARCYMSLLPLKLNKRTIRRVRLFLDNNESDWAIYQTTRTLLSLPHFTELELGLVGDMDLEYLIRRLEPVTGLRKLTLLSAMHSLRLRSIATLISNNENLTHFDWRPAVSLDFSELFRDVPTTKPLKLRHVSLGRGCANFDALIPHIRSLISFEFRYKERNLWCISFSQAKIFPRTIKVKRLDQELVTFISDHPRLVSLAIGSMMKGTGPQDSSSLCTALTRHSETLKHLSFQSKLLAFMLQNVENKANFLQSTRKLRELVLETEETLLQYQNARSRIYSERQILSVVAHLGHSLTVVIKARDTAIFSLCVAFCRDSANPLIRDLAGRIVYERVRG